MRSIFSNGCRSKNAGSNGTMRRTPYSGGRATRSMPERRSAPRAAPSASSIASSASRALTSSASPASVAETCRVVRTRSLTPRRRSRAAIERETEGWESPNSRAALEKLPLSTVRTNKASCCSRSFMLRVNISYLCWRDTYRRPHCLPPGSQRPPAPIPAHGRDKEHGDGRTQWESCDRDGGVERHWRGDRAPLRRGRGGGGGQLCLG